VHVALATDNVPPSLFHPIHHVVARTPRGASQPVSPEQCLTREEAIACASREGAYLTFEEDDKGTLEVGKLADVAVLDTDVLTAPADMIPGTRAELVIVGGRPVLDETNRWAPAQR
jgi:predicted amidohydrolase YtcJ